MKKALGILVLLLGGMPAGALLQGCNDCVTSKAEKFFDVQGVVLNAFRANTNQPIVADASVAAADIRLEVNLQARYYGFRARQSGWLPAAYAYEPSQIPGFGGTTEVLDSLEVRNTNAYDAAHPAGSSLNDLLVNQSSGLPLPVAPARGAAPEQHGLRLQLRQGPTQAGPQQFVLRYRLTNGETYVARTPRLVLQ